MIKVSIIIPIYKVESYVERCMESVFHQTYRNLEVILVDDCSPDRSMELARKCIEVSPLSKDLQFVYMRHDHNRGLSAARNTGIDAATGEYVFFLDSDDEITDDCISLLQEPLRDFSYDFVNGYYEVRGWDLNFPPQTLKGGLFGVKNIAKAYQCNQWHCMAWNKLCNLSYIKANDLYFQEGLIHEDELWSGLLASTAKSMYSVPVHTYIYYVRNNSITTNETNDVKLTHSLRILKGFYEYQEIKSLYFEGIGGIENRIKQLILGQLLQKNVSSLERYETFRKCDVRSIKTKCKRYSSVKEIILNFDQFLPSVIGYKYKRMMEKIRSIRS